MLGASVVFSSSRADWRTPPKLFDALNKEFRFTLDVCASRENRLCDRYIGLDHHDEWMRDALRFWWGEDEVVFMNPPYSRELGIDIAPFVQAAYGSADVNTVVALVPARTDTRWWTQYVMLADEVRLIPHRVKFLRPDGTEADSAGFPSAVVVWRRAMGRARFPSPRVVTWDYLP